MVKRVVLKHMQEAEAERRKKGDESYTSDNDSDDFSALAARANKRKNGQQVSDEEIREKTPIKTSRASLRTTKRVRYDVDTGNDDDFMDFKIPKKAKKREKEKEREKGEQREYNYHDTMYEQGVENDGRVLKSSKREKKDKRHREHKSSKLHGHKHSRDREKEREERKERKERERSGSVDVEDKPIITLRNRRLSKLSTYNFSSDSDELDKDLNEEPIIELDADHDQSAGDTRHTTRSHISIKHDTSSEDDVDLERVEIINEEDGVEEEEEEEGEEEEMEEEDMNEEGEGREEEEDDDDEEEEEEEGDYDDDELDDEYDKRVQIIKTTGGRKSPDDCLSKSQGGQRNDRGKSHLSKRDSKYIDMDDDDDDDIGLEEEDEGTMEMDQDREDDADIFSEPEEKMGTSSGRLTSRQRAMRGQTELELVELPQEGRRRGRDIPDEEKAHKRSEKARKRKLVAKKHEEEAKQQTIRQLLNTQDRQTEDTKFVKTFHELTEPFIRSISNKTRITIQIPEEALQSTCLLGQRSSSPPPIRMCGVGNCQQPRRYLDSTTNIPLCSLSCYRILHPTVSI